MIREPVQINPSKGIRRYREKLIPLHAQIYVIGHARERKDQVAVEIAYDEDDPVYVISTRGEKRVSSEYWERFTIFTIVGFIISIILPWLSISGRLMDPLSIAPLTMTELNPRICFVPSIIFVISLFIGWALVIYNSLVNLRNVVDHAWSMIDIQLNRRSDLIPNLVEVLEGYSKHEEAIYSQITVLRSQTLRQEAPIGVTSLLQSVAEDYPELKAGQKFLELQQAVEETEQRIALARDYYNNQTRFYNTRLEMVPDSYMASLGGFILREYWVAESFKRAQEEINLVA